MGQLECAVPVKLLDEAFAIATEFHDERFPARLEHPAYLSRTLLTHRARKMMQHHGAQHPVEVRVGKWKLLHDCVREGDTFTRACSLLT